VASRSRIVVWQNGNAGYTLIYGRCIHPTPIKSSKRYFHLIWR
jgi:hypothetical protein